MAYKVIKAFRDVESGNFYKEGDNYPVDEPTQERINTLLTGKNTARAILIEKVKQPKVDKPKTKTKGSK